MKKRKLKGFVLPTLYAFILVTICISVGFLSISLNKKPTDYNYSMNNLTENIVPVISEKTNIKPINPYNDNNVNLSKDYYSKDDEEINQQNSLIYFENTYMENTGLLYTSNESFDILATLDGTIKSVTDDEVLGKVVEIKHNNNLSTFYYSLSEVNVKEGDLVKSGDVIGKSGENKIENKEGTSLLFEVYYQGKSMDPDQFYATDIDNLE